MYKKLAFFLACIVLSFPSIIYSQSSLIGQDTRVLKASINLVQNEFVLGNSSDGQAGDLIKQFSARLENGEILVNFSLPKLKESEFYQAELLLDLNGRPIVPRKEDFIGTIGDKVITSGESNNEVTLTNLVQNYINLVGDLKLTLKIKHFAPQPLLYGVTCDEVPQFTTKQRLPYLYGAIVGAASLGIGQILRQSALDDFELHEAEDDFFLAEEHFLNYEDKAGTAEILTYAGIALLVVDAVGYTVRTIRHKKRMDVYDEYCNPQSGLSLKPFSTVTRDQQFAIGLKLGHTF